MNAIFKKICVAFYLMLHPTVHEQNKLEVIVLEPKEGMGPSTVTIHVGGREPTIIKIDAEDIANHISCTFMVESGHRLGAGPGDRIYASVQIKRDVTFIERVEHDGVATDWTISLAYEQEGVTE